MNSTHTLKDSRTLPMNIKLRCKLQTGFTLIEMIVAVAVIAIISTIAVPMYDDIILSSRLRTYSYDLLSAAQLARSEAIKSHAVVSLCASDNGGSCSGEWKDGWIVINSSNQVLGKYPAIEVGYKITDIGALTTINFQPTGIGSTQARLTICRETPTTGSNERLVDISVTGRATLTKTTIAAC